jgi:hypothetical protein
MSDDRPYKVFSPTKIWMSPTARAWAKEHGMSERDFAKYLIARHEETGDPFAHDTGGHAAGRDKIRGFEPEPLDPFAGDVGVPVGRSDIEGFAPEALDPFLGDVGVPAGRGDIEGFAPQVLAETASDLLNPFAGDVGTPAGRKDIEGFRPEPERQRIHDAESYWGTKW